MKITKELLIDVSEEIYQNTQKNIDKVHGLYDPTSEEHKFYLGLLSRQLYLVADITCLLRYGFHPGLTSVFIICRTIVDDFIQLYYVANHANPSEQITFLNADAHDKNHKKIAELAEINETKLGGNFPYYPTYAFVEEMKNKVLANPDKDKYFKDKANYKYHRFLNKRQIIDHFSNDVASADLARVYFRWKVLSDFLHYSKFTYEYEAAYEEITDEYDSIMEVLYYGYLATKYCMEFFEHTIGQPFTALKKIEDINVEYLQQLGK